MQFGIIGISYRQAPIEVRDRAAFSDSKKIEFYDRLRERGICQAVILSTCNRSEVSFLMADEKESAVVKEEFLLQCGSPELKEYLFEKKGEEALHYLFCVAAGLDSLVVGEDQILGQVQSALDFSRRVGGCGKQMNRIFLDAITCAKKIKTQLKISEHPISLCYIGMKCLAKACKIEGKTALVIGSGKMAALALTYLRDMQAKQIYLCNRSMEHALTLKGEEERICVLPFAQRYSVMDKCDIVVSATASPHLVVRREQMGKREHSLYLLDLATPRDIDPTLAEEEGVQLFDIDSLRGVSEENRKERQHLVTQGREIAAGASRETLQWLAASRVDPAIASLQSRCAAVEEDTYEMLDAKLHFSDHEKRAVRKILHAGFKRLIREPILALKGLDNELEQRKYGEVICSLFSDKEEGHHAH